MVRALSLSLLISLISASSALSACRLALALAMDVSSSVDAEEDRLQRAGLAAALVSPEVSEAILIDPDAAVALALYEWSGRYQQEVHLDWVLLRTRADIERAAGAIASSERMYNAWPTALGYAIGYSARLFARAPQCDRLKLDVSGDGENNEGFGPALAYRNFPLDGVTVNALAIGTHASRSEELTLVDYYRNELIRGPGAFVEQALDYRDFERAMRRKLVRELSLPQLGAAGDPAQGINTSLR